ncbi:MAG TPA: hypothetical protein EYG51_16950 [Pseudomonadales bacterium]|nr:hypothetical protein [Pseudomonadales bacterium]
MRLVREYIRGLLTEQSDLWDYPIGPDRRVFISREPFGSFRNAAQPPAVLSMQKPEGLWYGCGSSWIDFVRTEMSGTIEEVGYLYEIVPSSAVLRIRDDDEFQQFERDFASPELDMIGQKIIDWPMVAATYAGIEICPYNPRRRTKSMWYYGWDVASGCIWDSSGIAGAPILLAQKEGDSL